MMNPKFYGDKLVKVRNRYLQDKETILHDVNLSDEGRKNAMKALRFITRDEIKEIEKAMQQAAETELAALGDQPKPPVANVEQAELEKRSGELLRSRVMMSAGYTEAIQELRKVVDSGTQEDRTGLLRIYHDLKAEMLNRWGEVRHDEGPPVNPWEGINNRPSMIQDQRKVAAGAAIDAETRTLFPMLQEAALSKAERDYKAKMQEVKVNISEGRSYYDMMQRACKADFADLNE